MTSEDKAIAKVRLKEAEEILWALRDRLRNQQRSLRNATEVGEDVLPIKRRIRATRIELDDAEAHAKRCARAVKGSRAA